MGWVYRGSHCICMEERSVSYLPLLGVAQHRLLLKKVDEGPALENLLLSGGDKINQRASEIPRSPWRYKARRRASSRGRHSRSQVWPF